MDASSAADLGTLTLAGWSPSSIDEILDLTGGHPLVRGVGGPRRGTAWHAPDGRTVAFTGLDAEERVRVLVVLGPPDQAAEMLLAVRDQVPADGYLIVPRGTPLPLSATTDWNFRAATTPPPPQPAEGAVGWGADHEAITELLKLTSPES